MLFYQERFDKFVSTFTGTPVEFYNSKDARNVLRFHVGVLRKARERELWQNYVDAYADIYNARNNPQLTLTI